MIFFPASRRRIVAAILVCLAFAAPTHATVIDVGALNGIYSQANFGSTPIEMRVRSSTEIVNPGFVNTTVGFSFTDPFFIGELGDLFALGGPAPTINVFLVNSLPSAFGPLSGIAQVLPDGSRGNNVAVAAGLSNVMTEIVAHEIGHALGLDHERGNVGPFDPPDFNFPNLMSVGANGDTTLELSQIATIFDSPYVRGNANDGFYIDVQPFSIVAEATVTLVPVPPTFTFLLLGIAFAGMTARRRYSRP